MTDNEGKSGDQQDAHGRDDRNKGHPERRGSSGERSELVSRSEGLRTLSIDHRVGCRLREGKRICFDPDQDIANSAECQHVPVFELSRRSNLAAVYESAVRRAAIGEIETAFNRFYERVAPREAGILNG